MRRFAPLKLRASRAWKETQVVSWRLWDSFTMLAAFGLVRPGRGLGHAALMNPPAMEELKKRHLRVLVSASGESGAVRWPPGWLRARLASSCGLGFGASSRRMRPRWPKHVPVRAMDARAAHRRGAGPGVKAGVEAARGLSGAAGRTHRRGANRALVSGPAGGRATRAVRGRGLGPP